MDIETQGIRTKKKWYYNDLGEKADYVEEVFHRGRGLVENNI